MSSTAKFFWGALEKSFSEFSSQVARPPAHVEIVELSILEENSLSKSPKSPAIWRKSPQPTGKPPSCSSQVRPSFFFGLQDGVKSRNACKRSAALGQPKIRDSVGKWIAAQAGKMTSKSLLKFHEFEKTRNFKNLKRKQKDIIKQKLKSCFQNKPHAIFS